MMAGRDCGTSARRRRERRLRSAWRHEQLSVAMALAAATHNSAQPNAALRGQKMGNGASEEEVHETNDALRGLKRPHPGERPGNLAEPGPQRSDRSLRHSSGNAPLLVVATLAAAAADGVDAATLAFLTVCVLEDRRKEEQEEKEKEKKAKEKEKAKAKKTLRRFSGWVFKLPGAQGQCGFIEPDEAKVVLALERDFPFSASYLESFAMGDHVTFSVRRDPLEAFGPGGAAVG